MTEAKNAQQSEDNIAVAIRVRPIINTERKKQKEEKWCVLGNEIYLKDPTSVCREVETFTFDYILDTSSTNEDLYNVVQPLVHSTLRGYNATIFAYGQTSSGKTHSILGRASDPGLIPRSAQDIFSVIASNNKFRYIVSLAYVEIYNEKLNDLLDMHNKDLRISAVTDTRGSTMIGRTERVVHNAQEMMAVIQEGNKNRQVGETKMNERSSRSHVICDVLIEQIEDSSSVPEGEEVHDLPAKIGHLYIVDLAGSERVSQTGATGMRLNEGVAINKSLSVLISVITQLNNGSNFVSYRDSKLTRMLENALSGNSRTLIVATITPVSIDATLSTLKFARSAKNIKTKPKLNEVLSTQSRIKRQQAREKELLNDLREKGDLIHKLQEELAECRNWFVPSRQKAPLRRHTMGVPSDILMEPIMECDEESKNSPSVEVAFSATSCRCTKPACDETSEKYRELAMQLNQLDESHASLKEFTKLELELQIQDRVNEQALEFRRREQELQAESEKCRVECANLRSSYEMLDVSHLNLKEFTEMEVDLAANERARLMEEEIGQLKREKAENDRFKERCAVLEAEQELLQASQSTQHQRRCDELLARIRELECGAAHVVGVQAANVDEECAEERARQKAQLVLLQERCDKLEADMVLAEKHSKILLDENNALKGCPSALKRSTSDSKLTAIGECIQEEEECSKEDFQGIYTSLRNLTSTIIWKTNDTEVKEIEDLKKENVMLKEHTSELLAKLKTLNDKLNSRVVDHECVFIYKEKIKQLQEEKGQLEGRLRQQSDHTNKNKVIMEDVEYLQQLENKVIHLEKNLKEYEALIKSHEDSESRINQLTEELNDFKKHESKVNDSLPNQNSKFIAELQEKLRTENIAFRQKEVCIQQLQKQLLKKEEQENTLFRQLKELQQEHQHATDKVKCLEEQILALDANNENKTDMIEQSQHEQQIRDLKQQLVHIEGVVLGKAEELKQKEEHIETLEGKLKEERHEHGMDKEALEYASNELDEAMAKIKEQQINLKNLTTAHEAKVTELLKELESHQSRKNSNEGDPVKVLALEADLMNVLEVLEQKNAQLQEYQELLQAKTEEHKDCNMKMEASLSNFEEVSSKLNMLQNQFGHLEHAKEQQDGELSKLQSQLAQKEESLSQLQATLAATNEQWQQNKTTAENNRRESEREIEGKRDKISQLEEELMQNKNATQLQTLIIEELEAHQVTNIEELTRLQVLLTENESKLCKLHMELDVNKEECYQVKTTAVVAHQTHQDEIQALQSKLDELAMKNEELEKLTAALQVKLENTEQLWHDDNMAAADDKQNYQDAIETKNKLINEFGADITELQKQLDAAVARTDSGDEEVIRLRGLLTENDKTLTKLSAECEQLRQECHQRKLAVIAADHSIITLREQHNQELQQEIQRANARQTEINELAEELLKYKKVEEQLDAALNDREDMRALHEKHVQEFANLQDEQTFHVNQLTTELEVASSKLSILKVELERMQLDYQASQDKITELETNLRLKDSEFKASAATEVLKMKYEQALGRINSLEEDLRTAKNINMQLNMEDANKQHTLSFSSNNQKVKELEDELKQTRRELHLTRERLSCLRIDHEQIMKSKNELHLKLEEMSSVTDTMPTNKLTARIIAQNQKQIEEKLKQNNLTLKQAEATIKTLRDENQALMQQLEKFKADTRQNSKAIELVQVQEKYDQLRHQYNQYMENNRNHLDVERRELTELRSELLAKQSMHERQVAGMTEDFERKYRAHSDKYAALNRQKDARIAELEAQLEQSNKENCQNQQPTSMPPNQSLTDANKREANARQKVADLQRQLLCFRQEGQGKAVFYEKQIAKLHEDYREQIAAVQAKLESQAADLALPNARDLAMAKQKENFARLIDAELFAIPAKLAIIKKVASIRLQVSVCLVCSRIERHLSELLNNCLEHPAWDDFQLTQHNEFKNRHKEIATDRFNILTETRNVFVKLLECSGSIVDMKMLIKAKFEQVKREIAEYHAMLKTKTAFLQYLREQLQATSANISKEYEVGRTTCEQCKMFSVRYDVVYALSERVNCSLVIINGLSKELHPLPFCTENVKGYDKQLEMLMSSFDELTMNVLTQEELTHFKDKYKRAKRVAEMRYKDVQLMASVLEEENYTINYKVNPIQITKTTVDERNTLEDDNPRPVMGRSRDSGRKSLGATPKHFSPFFITPDEHKEAKHEARRHK